MAVRVPTHICGEPLSIGRTQRIPFFIRPFDNLSSQLRTPTLCAGIAAPTSKQEYVRVDVAQSRDNKTIRKGNAPLGTFSHTTT